MNIHSLLQFVPASWLRRLGQLQFRVPFLRSLIHRGAEFIASSEGVIQRGEGRGLRFCAKGGYPGYLLGTSEPEEQALLAKLLPSGGTFYDIGANIGFYSTLAARIVGTSGHVFAFEPFHQSAESCGHNADINGFTHVSVVEAAVTSHSGTVRLELQGTSAMHRIGEGQGLDVASIGIDHWRGQTGAPPPQVVMMDIEGAELDALKGMRETIRQHLPVLMIEVHWLGQAFTEYVNSELVPLGYRATTYGGGEIPAGFVRYHLLLVPARSSGTPHA